MDFDLTIHPFVGVGRLQFGMTRDEVADLYGPADRQVDHFGGAIVDYYTNALLSLSYDERGGLEFVEWHATRSATTRRH